MKNTEENNKKSSELSAQQTDSDIALDDEPYYPTDELLYETDSPSDDSSSEGEIDVSSKKRQRKTIHRRPLGKRLSRRLRSILKLLLRIALVVAAVALISLIYINRDSFSAGQISDWVNDNLLNITSSDFPVSISGSRVSNIKGLKNSAAVLTDTSLMIINKDGKPVVTRQHNLSNPLMVCSKNGALVYEVGSNSVTIDNRNSTSFELTTDNKLLAADMNYEGYYAYATRSSNGYMSEFHVYNNKNQHIYQSFQSKYLITGLSISEDSKSVAVLMIGVKSGEYTSIVKLFSLDSETPTEFTFDNTLLLKAVNTGSGILTLSQEGADSYDNSGELIDSIKFTNELSGYSQQSGELALYFQKNQADGSNLITVINGQCDLINEASIKEDISDYCMDEGRLFVLTPDTLYCYDEYGDYKSEWIMQGSARSFDINDGYAFVYDNNSITRINVG